MTKREKLERCFYLSVVGKVGLEISLGDLGRREVDRQRAGCNLDLDRALLDEAGILVQELEIELQRVLGKLRRSKSENGGVDENVSTSVDL